MARVDLSQATLVGIRLPGCDLSESRIVSSDLSGADLRWCTLVGATFTHSRLQGADLSEADLTLANLNRADLEGASLRGCRLSGTVLAGVENLHRACGLETVRVHGATDLGMTVLRQGAAEFPTEFLEQFETGMLTMGGAR